VTHLPIIDGSEGMVISALLMLRRLMQALRVALRDQDFGRVLSAGLALIVIGTLAYSLDPELTITDRWLKVFTSGYVLVGIGILVEIARRLGMGFITARAELEAEKRAGL
jgi:hypothetical protein